MVVDDILDIKAVTNVGGVDTVVGFFWKVNAFRGPDSDGTIIDQWAADFWATITAAVSQDATFSCVKMVNLTTPAKVVRFPGLAGTGLEDSHPPHQVVRIESYGRESLGEPAWRNSLNLSGIIESLSTRGRTNDPTPFQGLVDFVTDIYVGGANGADFVPLIRRTTALGGPGLPDTYLYIPVEYTALREKFETLRSRRFRLCV